MNKLFSIPHKRSVFEENFFDLFLCSLSSVDFLKNNLIDHVRKSVSQSQNGLILELASFPENEVFNFSSKPYLRYHVLTADEYCKKERAARADVIAVMDSPLVVTQNGPGTYGRAVVGDELKKYMRDKMLTYDKPTIP